MFSKALAICIFVCIISCCLPERFLGGLEKEDVRAVRHRLEEEKEKRLLLQNDVEVLMLKIAQLERNLSAIIKDKVPDTRLGSPKTIGFHASFSKTNLNLANGNTLIFDHVLSNQGDAYSSSTGVFRTPTAGTYFFALHLLAAGAKTLHNGIYKNDVMVGRAYAGGTGSQSVVVSLDIGDEVYVRAYANGVIHGGNYCAFSGFLIR